MPIRQRVAMMVLALLGLACLPSAARAQTYTSFDLTTRAVARRAVEAVIWGMPAVNYDLMRQEMLDATDAEVGQVVYWGRPLDWMNQTLTPNPDTLYFMTFFDTRAGPVVLDIPPAEGGSLNGNIVTAWQMPLEDVGRLGVDKGAGGRFVVLPPGYEGAVPDGMTPLRSDTFGGYALFRSNLASHDAADIATSVAYGKRIKVYPLAAADNPPETVFVDAQDVLFDSTIRYDATFFENLDRVVQEEPWIDRDRVMIDMLRTVGIEKGKPFRPDAETRALLGAAAVEAKALLAADYEHGWGTFFEGTQWRPAADATLVRAAPEEFKTPDIYPVDVRGLTYTYGYIGIKRLGVGQFYLIAIADKTAAPLDGAATYRLRVPPDAPVEQYWSATLYDSETHALIKHVPRASRSSNAAEVQRNPDGSVDLWFGPGAPDGHDANWVPTQPARGFEVMFRLYGPTEALFKKTWALPDIEKVN